MPEETEDILARIPYVVNGSLHEIVARWNNDGEPLVYVYKTDGTKFTTGEETLICGELVDDRGVTIPDWKYVAAKKEAIHAALQEAMLLTDKVTS